MKLKKKDYLNILIILSIFLWYLIIIYLSKHVNGFLQKYALAIRIYSWYSIYNVINQLFFDTDFLILRKTRIKTTKQ